MILLDPIAAFVFAMLLWTAIIVYTFFMAARERRGRLKPRSRPNLTGLVSEIEPIESKSAHPPPG
jgi:hypothetical protein